MIKIPSGEITNVPYLRKIGKLKKKIILSSGMSNIKEVKEAVKILTSQGTKKRDITVLHCTSEYPANQNTLNLLSIPFLKEKLKINVGYSDHSTGITASLVAVSLGAKVIEKHFTTSKKLSGPDQKTSLLPNELSELIKEIRCVETSLGTNKKKPFNNELKNSKFVRKYIVAKKKINKGEKFTEKNIVTKRALPGIHASKWDSIIGRRAKRNFNYDENIKS